MHLNYYVSNPSASHRSTRISIICGSGTLEGNMALSFPPFWAFLHRFDTIQSIISSTSRLTAPSFGTVLLVVNLFGLSLLREIPVASHCSRPCSHFASPSWETRLDRRWRSFLLRIYPCITAGYCFHQMTDSPLFTNSSDSDWLSIFTIVSLLSPCSSTLNFVADVSIICSLKFSFWSYWIDHEYSNQLNKIW